MYLSDSNQVGAVMFEHILARFMGKQVNILLVFCPAAMWAVSKPVIYYRPVDNAGMGPMVINVHI